MLWIGISGGLATGKSTVTKILRKHGFSVADADQFAHDIVQPGKPALKEIQLLFGHEMIKNSGELNRQKLAEVVFTDGEKKQKLESILHPRIQTLVSQFKQQQQESGAKVSFYDVPLLFEKNLESQFDATILIRAPQDLQVKRFIERTGLAEHEALQRIQNQLPLFVKSQRATYVIDNIGSEKDLENEIVKVVNSILSSGNK